MTDKTQDTETQDQTTVFRNRIVGHDLHEVAQIVSNPLNWRIHPKDQMLALGAVFDEVGIVDEIKINVTTGNLVDGHARTMLADQRGEKFLPTTYVELSPEEEEKILATLNPLADMALKHRENFAMLHSRVKTKSAALQALLDHVAGGRRTTHDAENPEIEFTIEVEEEQNYVVFAFDNKFDWNVVVEAFGISTVKSLDSTETYSRQGTGRVLDGKKLVEYLKEKLS